MDYTESCEGKMKEATHYYDHHIRIYYKVSSKGVWFWDKYTQRWLKSNCYPPVEFMTEVKR